MKLINTLLVIGFISLISCTNDSVDGLMIEIDTITYTNRIKVIIDSNCIACHNSDADAIGPFPLETYEQVKDKVENGQLLVRIQLEQGDGSLMPQGGDRLSQGLINDILSWQDEGYLE